MQGDRVNELVGKIRARIADDGLRKGDRLPSQDELATTLSASKSTVGLAIAVLETEGLVAKGEGRGGTVLVGELPGASGVIVSGNVALADHAAEVANQDGSIFGTVNVFRNAELTAAPAYVARYLDVPEGSEVVYRFRERRSQAGEPIMLAESWAPGHHAELVPEQLLLADVPGGISRTEQVLGRTYQWILESLEAVHAPERAAAFYGCDESQPLLQVDHRWLMDGNEPLLFGRGWQPPGQRRTYRMPRP